MPHSVECIEMDPYSRRLCAPADSAGAPEISESTQSLLAQGPEPFHLPDEPHKECPRAEEGVKCAKTAARLVLFRFLFLRKWLRDYSLRKLQLDVMAGITVGVIAIPQSMAYASLAGLPPIYGLYSCTVPLVMYGLFGSCGQLAVGPTAVHAMIIAEFILGETAGGVELMEVAGVLAFYSGVLRICLGLCNMGFLARLLSHSVMSGFASAAGVMISLSQLRSLTGLPMQRGRTLFQSLYYFALSLPSFSLANAATLAMGTAVIAFLVLIRKVRRLPKWFPSQLIAMVVCTAVCGLFELNARAGIQVLEDIPSGLPPFSPPLIDEHTSVEVYFQPVLVLTAMAFMECISLGQKFSQERGYRLDPSQELFALGMANTFGALLSGFPVTGSFSRSMVNAHVGAVTPLANVATAAVVAAALSFLMPCFYYLPKTCLAAIIISSTLSLIDVEEITWLWRHRLPDRIVWLSAFVATVSLGVGPGVIIGVGISFAMLIRNTAKPHPQAPSTRRALRVHQRRRLPPRRGACAGEVGRHARADRGLPGGERRGRHVHPHAGGPQRSAAGPPPSRAARVRLRQRAPFPLFRQIVRRLPPAEAADLHRHQGGGGVEPEEHAGLAGRRAGGLLHLTTPVVAALVGHPPRRSPGKVGGPPCAPPPVPAPLLCLG